MGGLYIYPGGQLQEPLLVQHAAGGGGLQLVLASYGLRSALVAGIVKGLGVLGIHIGNAFANTVIRSIASAGIGAGADWIFTNIIDGWDGRRDNQLRIG